MGHGPAQQVAVTEEVSDLFFEMREHLLEGARRAVRVEDLIFSRCVDHDNYWRLCLASTTFPAFNSALFFGCSFCAVCAIAAGGDSGPARLQFDVAGNGCQIGGGGPDAAGFGLRPDPAP